MEVVIIVVAADLRMLSVKIQKKKYNSLFKQTFNMISDI
jgi:hypothetical protein